jgi:hypothetical protein
VTPHPNTSASASAAHLHPNTSASASAAHLHDVGVGERAADGSLAKGHALALLGAAHVAGEDEGLDGYGGATPQGFVDLAKLHI